MATRLKLKDKKIIIYKDVSGKDSAGFPVYGYKPIHPGKLWAYTRQLSAKEFYASAQVQVNEERLFTVNWRSDLEVLEADKLYISYNGLWYHLTRIDTYEDYKKDIYLYATAGSTKAPGSLLPYDGK